jgi:hypothetical protein
LSLIQVLPALELYRDGALLSERSQSKLEWRNRLSMRWIDLVGFLLPNAAGNPYADIPVFRHSRLLYHEKAAYLGLIPILSAVIGLSRSRTERWQWGCATLCLLGVIIALADHTPVFAWLCRIIPGLDLFRCQGRVLAVSSVLFALLATRGLDAFLHQELVERRRVIGFLVTMAALGVTASTARAWRAQPIVRLYLQYYAIRYLVPECLATAFVLAATILVLRFGRRLRTNHPQLACALLLLLSFGDLWYFQLRHFHLIAPEPSILPTNTQGPLRLAVDSTDPDAWRYSTLIRPAIERHGSTAATNEGGVLPQALERLYDAFANPNTQIAAIGLSATDLMFDDDLSSWRPAHSSLPRIRFCQGQEAPHLIPEKPPGPLEASDLERPGKGVATVIEENPQYLLMSAALPESEWLIVADTFYPGWQGRVDGVDALIMPAHGCFRGVFLEPGQHQVEFQYRPRSFRVGAAGSAAGLVVLGGMLWLGRRHKHSSGDSPQIGEEPDLPPLKL